MRVLRLRGAPVFISCGLRPLFLNFFFQAAGGEVYIMGSYKLNVHEPGADIDLCCVVPLHISRQDFFTSLYSTLE
jgi:poly(A) polymerase Pap1